jgi:rare lipoprotein A
LSWIKLFILATIVASLTTGCSHRFKKSPYFEKHKSSSQKNYFNPRFADKSKKVRLDDTNVETGSEPDVASHHVSNGVKKHPTMRAYSINGVRYYPSEVSVGETFTGISSWYGPDFNGKLTSNGEYYDMYAFTAAHKTLPMHTIVRVTSLDNMKQVTVRINDRGPFVKGRIIDLSKAAARKIDMTAKGTAPVRLEILGFNDGKTKVKQVETSTPTYTPTVQPVKTQVMHGFYYVQIGSFSLLEGAQTYKSRYDSLGEHYKAIIKEQNVKGRKVFKVLISGFKSDAEARDYINTHNGFENAFIIRD